MSSPATVGRTDAPPAPPASRPDAAAASGRAGGFGGRRRYHEVDLLRLLAAVGVVGFHFLFRSSTTDPVLADTGFRDPGGVFHYGNIGVPLFFVISGFVILNSAWNRSAVSFLASRVGRLYPAFWTACTLTAVVMAFDPTDRFTVSFTQWATNLSMFSEAYGVDYVDGVYWTLTIELAFYLIMLAFVRIGLTTNRIIGFCLGWLALSMVHAYIPAPDWLQLVLVPSWAPYFVAGMLFSLIARDGWKWKYVLPLGAAYLCCGRWAIHYFNALSDKYDVVYSPIVIAVVVTAIFAVFAAISSGYTLPGAAKVAFLAGLTYPLYLIHENIGFIALDLLHSDMGINRYLVLAAVLLGVGAIAWALHVGVENRFSRPLANLITRTWTRIRGVLRARVPALVG
ncbi:acyltransferase family protein [Actinocatenispora rupis]|uniref:Acyltransferase n=1 Tax=Actinocatenispora rupis TaxID=519421 RepID=A0A8J3JHD5_9ACTN|nr:acyltransferase [Actinocatenispora rupis]GID15898.1 acyltransferase [Actinocatenispora rupis]